MHRRSIGAVIGEVVGELLTKGKTRNEIDEIEVLNKSKLVAGSVAAIMGRKVDIAVAAAHIAVKFNTVNKEYAGTIEQFIHLMNISPSRVGMQNGNNAEEILIKFSQTDWKFKPDFVTYFNNKKGRYIYTKKGGWIDVSHFLFYAGIAYKTKKSLEAQGKFSKSQIEEQAIYRAMKYGYVQEISDLIFSKNSAFEYEDLPSDRYGATFAAKYFNPNSKLNLGEQIKQYFDDNLIPTHPQNAPNYSQLPEKDKRKHSGIRNYKDSPLFTK